MKLEATQIIPINGYKLTVLNTKTKEQRDLFVPKVKGVSVTEKNYKDFLMEDDILDLELLYKMSTKEKFFVNNSEIYKQLNYKD